MAAKKTKQITNYIAIALDTSGSMGVIREDVRLAYNDMLRTIRERTEAEKQQTFVSVVMFESSVTVLHFPTDIRSVQDIPPGGYPILGQTALFDGVAKAVETIDAARSSADTSYLVLVFTDGEENCSFRNNAPRIRKLIAEKQDTDLWTFAFQMPPGKGAAFAKTFGIPVENIREWEQTKRGVQEVGATTNAGLTNYFGQRSKGATSVRSFYNLTTDLSSVKTKDFKQLDDLTRQFKSWTVDKECSISAFIEVKTGKPYVIGSTFYQLTKPEKVQPQKDVLLMKKGEKVIRGGADARGLIGLPPNADARVTPGNHADYDIFVRSTSPNRKLVRGTKVLVDTGLVVGLVPTWDYQGTGKTA